MTHFLCFILFCMLPIFLYRLQGYHGGFVLFVIFYGDRKIKVGVYTQSIWHPSNNHMIMLLILGVCTQMVFFTSYKELNVIHIFTFTFSHLRSYTKGYFFEIISKINRKHKITYRNHIKRKLILLGNSRKENHFYFNLSKWIPSLYYENII